MLKLDLIQTVAFAGVVLFVGYGMRHALKPLARFNVPAPVIGGLLVAVAALLARHWDLAFVEFDQTLQSPLMIAFFASIGFGASASFLRSGGSQVIVFFVIATVVALAQNLLGVLLASPLGMPPLFGVLAGSVTLAGGPATGLAFAPLFEQAGVPAAASVAMAAAMAGIICGGLLGGPIGTWLIERHNLKTARPRGGPPDMPRATATVASQECDRPSPVPEGERRETYVILKNLVAILTAIWLGSWVSKGFVSLGITLPAPIGAMLAASALRNLDDATGVIGLSQRILDVIGSVALSLFLAMALMSVKLWELAGLALPLVILLLAQVALITLLSLLAIHRLTGCDYDAAVMSSGFCGFMLGTTANAMANMEALVEKYGPAPRAFLVVPMVGAFFIDFTNALIITAFLNFWH